MAETSPPQHTAPGTPQNEIPVEVEGFSEEERQDIVDQIDQVARSNRLSASQAFSNIQPQKKGSLFPIVVNLLALILIGAGIFGANYYFNQQIEALSMESDQLESTEGKILEAVKKESEEQLSAKEAEISQIREDLQQIAQQRQSLQENMQAQIEAKEQQLRNDLEATLRQERERLESQGVSSQELEERLQEFRQQQEQEYQAALEEYQRETSQQIAEKEQELQEAQATAEQILAEANREKAEILEETQQREAELRQQFETERERLTAEASEVQQELERLSEIRSNEQLYRDQINGMYRNIQQALEQGNRQTAQARITDMREFLQNISVQDSPSLAKRMDIDQFMIGLLEEQILNTSAAGPDESLLESAKTISTLRTTVAEAQKLQQEGNLYEAKRYFSRATELIPAVSTAVNQLESINRQEQADRIRQLLSTGESAVENQQYDQAIESFTAAVTEAAEVHSAAAGSALKGIIEILNNRLQTTAAEYEQRISSLERQTAQLEEQNQALSDELQQRSNSTTQLSREVEQKDTRISRLEKTLSTQENRINSLSNQIEQLESEKQQLEQRYQRVRRQVDTLNKELNDAVNEMADLISRDESTSP